MPETVLIIGSTGNIGVSAIQSAQRLGWDILAVVRNQDSAKKIFDHVDKKGINTIEVDILADDGVAKIVEWARMGTLPAFQHVIAAGGGAYDDTPLKDITPQRMRELLHQNFDFAFLAYHATIPYLLEQGAASTFTLCTGAQGDFCRRGGPACTQGALYSMATSACRENAETNIRFNELYLALRVDFDETAKKDGTMSTTDFSRAWDHVFRDQLLKGMRIEVQTAEDLDKLNAYSKIEEANEAEARSGH